MSEQKLIALQARPRAIEKLVVCRQIFGGSASWFKKRVGNGIGTSSCPMEAESTIESRKY